MHDMTCHELSALKINSKSEHQAVLKAADNRGKAVQLRLLMFNNKHLPHSHTQLSQPTPAPDAHSIIRIAAAYIHPSIQLHSLPAATPAAVVTQQQ